MVPYLITFFISILLCWFAEKKLQVNKRKYAYILLFLSVLVVSLLAGFRDETIGTDLLVYCRWEFLAAAKSNNLIDLIKERVINVEPLYIVLNYIVTRFTVNENIFYFVVAFLIYGFMMLGIVSLKDKVSISISWMCFLLLFYSDTLNILRQSIALAISFFAMHYVLEKKYAKYILFLTIAILFHYSAIVSVLVTIIYIITKKSNQKFTIFFIIMIFGCLVFLLNPILSFMLNIGFVPEKYIRYLSNDFGFSINALLIRTPILVLIVCYWNEFRRKQTSVWSNFLFIVIILDIILVQLREANVALYRICMYFGIYRSIAYSCLAKSTKGHKRLLIILILIVYLLVLWIYQNVIQGNNGIYPYIFAN